MSAAIVWMDHAEAKVYRLAAGQSPRAEKLERHRHGHGVSEHHKEQDMENFFRELAQRIDGTGEVLLAGNGTGKQEFQHFLEKHRPNIAKSIVGSVTLDHPTEPQLFAAARKFFQTHDLYTGA